MDTARLHDRTTSRVVPSPQEDMPFSCSDCGKGYMRYTSLYRHRRFECGNKIPQFSCPVCPHRTKQKADLKRHILRVLCALDVSSRSHFLDSFYPPVSNNRLTARLTVCKGNRKSHRRHNPPSENAGNICQKCGKMYRLHASLKRHIRYECGQEPQYSCPSCEYQSHYKSMINRHLRKHSKLHGDAD